jgi:hypothetical protein
MSAIYENPGKFKVEQIKAIEQKIFGKTQTVDGKEVPIFNKTEYIGDSLLGKEKMSEFKGFLSDLKAVESLAENPSAKSSPMITKLTNKMVGFLIRNPPVNPTIIEKMPIDPELARKMIKSIYTVNPEIAAGGAASIPEARNIRATLVNKGVDPFLYDQKQAAFFAARANYQALQASAITQGIHGAGIPFMQPGSMASPSPGQMVSTDPGKALGTSTDVNVNQPSQ